MAGIKGMKTGGFGGRKPLSDEEKRSTYINFKVTPAEKELFLEAKGNESFADYLLKLVENDLKNKKS